MPALIESPGGILEVRFGPLEIIQSVTDAIFYWARAEATGMNRVGFEPKGGPFRRKMNGILGLIAEDAVHWFFGVWPPPRRSKNMFHQPDACGFLVRSTSIHYGLRLSGNDPKDAPYFSTEWRTKFVYRLIGQLAPGIGPALRALGVGRPWKGTDDGWEIPREYLSPCQRARKEPVLMANNGTTQLHTVELGDRQDGLMLTDYNGTIQINRFFQGSDGKNYPKMCYPKTKAGPSEKMLPMGINLGSPADAVRVLTQFLHVLKRANGLT